QTTYLTPANTTGEAAPVGSSSPSLCDAKADILVQAAALSGIVSGSSNDINFDDFSAKLSKVIGDSRAWNIDSTTRIHLDKVARNLLVQAVEFKKNRTFDNQQAVCERFFCIALLLIFLLGNPCHLIFY